MTGCRQSAGRMATLPLKFFTIAGLSIAAATAAAQDQAAMNQPHQPFQIYGNTYYVGTAGLASVLVTSEYGHVLVDTGLPESAPLIAGNIQALGFELDDVKAIVVSHAHVSHAGGAAELQRLTGAQIYALRPAEEVLRTGKLPKDDPQAAAKSPAIPTVERIWVATDGQLLGVGGIRLRVHATPGHSPGGATWAWEACEGSSCLDFVYADELTPVAAGRYKFKGNKQALDGFEQSFKLLEGMPCQLLLTPHPDAATLARLQQANGDAAALTDENACRNYAQQGRQALQAKLAGER